MRGGLLSTWVSVINHIYDNRVGGVNEILQANTRLTLSCLTSSKIFQRWRKKNAAKYNGSFRFGLIYVRFVCKTKRCCLSIFIERTNVTNNNVIENTLAKVVTHTVKLFSRTNSYPLHSGNPNTP